MSFKVAAIVPAYNEKERIALALRALSHTPDIGEIVVVDDGSKEPLSYLENDFPNIKVIRHEKNKGKAEAMTTGVLATLSPYLLFCDADLVGLLPEHINALIQPVLKGTCRMSIGIRGNPEQRMVRFIALNSGERCLSRADWESLPSFYKKGFRVETGLNFFIQKKGVIFPVELPYLQTLKERKYGFWRGFLLRWKMNMEIVTAWVYLIWHHFFKKND